MLGKTVSLPAAWPDWPRRSAAAPRPFGSQGQEVQRSEGASVWLVSAGLGGGPQEKFRLERKVEAGGISGELLTLCRMLPFPMPWFPILR